jgi:two-component system response regulator TctD
VNTRSFRILLVEDTPGISLWLGTALRQGGMEVAFASDGLQANAALQAGHGFDAVLLDLQLPELDGLSVLKALRERGDGVPVLILTARASVPDRVLGLNMGADDYLTKPFDLSELEARLQALLRRPAHMRHDQLRLGPLAMDAASGMVRVGEQALVLTRRESAVMRVLLESAQRPVSKEQLHAQVFFDEPAGLEAVEVLVYRLRKKLEGLPRSEGEQALVTIATIRGMGYRLVLPVARDTAAARHGLPDASHPPRHH